MGLTHIGDVLARVFVEKPVDGVRAVGRTVTGKTRSDRRAARAARLEEHKRNKELAKMVAAEEAKRLAHDAALRRAKLQMEAGQRLAASGSEELNRLKAEETLANSPTTSKNTDAPAKASGDPAPAPKTRARRGAPANEGANGDSVETGAEAETASAQ